jgi:hypothetical protein
MAYVVTEPCFDHEDEVPEAWKGFAALNREMAATCPPINERREPLARRPAGS